MCVQALVQMRTTTGDRPAKVSYVESHAMLVFRFTLLWEHSCVEKFWVLIHCVKIGDCFRAFPLQERLQGAYEAMFKATLAELR